MLRKYQAVFWDFDGVIKESIEVKSIAFEQLFMPFGRKISKFVLAENEYVDVKIAPLVAIISTMQFVLIASKYILEDRVEMYYGGGDNNE